MPALDKYNRILDALKTLLEKKRSNPFPSVKLLRRLASQKEVFTIIFLQKTRLLRLW